MDLITLALAKSYADNQLTPIKEGSPEAFGAVGDGVTDDTNAIIECLSHNKRVMFNGNGTYLVSSMITIPSNVYVDFCGATIVPKSNFDVFQVKPGAYIENLVVRCTQVQGWDSSVLVFYGGDKFSASNPTRLNNIKLFNDTSFNNGKSVGTGLYLYLDSNGRYIEGVSITQFSTCGFGYGIHMYDETSSDTPSAARGFIGANNFLGYWSYRDTIGICIEVKSTHGLATNNFFTDLNIQSDYYNSSQYAIYCSGDSNYFSGCLYDYSILDYHPVTAIYFSEGSTKNYVEVTAGDIYRPGYCIDLGSYNRVVTHHQEDMVILPKNTGRGCVGNQDDIFAFLDKKADCKLESLDIEPISGDISSVFNPATNKVLQYRENSEGKCRAIITVNLKKVLRKLSHLILQFPHRLSPKSIKITAFNAESVKVIYNTNINSLNNVIISPGLSGVPNMNDISKLIFEFGDSYDWEGTKQNGWGSVTYNGS